MKTLISAATIALTLLATTAAIAQRDNPNYQGPNYQGPNYQGPNYQGQNYDPRQDNGARFDRPAYNDRNLNDRNSDRPRWARGERLPDRYRQDQYAVRDWQQRNLREPPRGYRWSRNDDGQYLLAAIASGIIADVVSQNAYRDDYRWSRGDRLTGAYRDDRYVVSDWRANSLRQPGRGQRWVRINGQYMLMATRSGDIIQVIPAR